MANRNFKGAPKNLESGVIKLYGSFLTSTSGAIASQSCKGFSVAKTGSEAGRYTVTLEDQYMALLAVQAIVEGAADAAYTGAKGLTPFLRGAAVTADTPLFYLQFATTTFADAELEDGARVYIEITLKNSTSY